MRLTKSLTAPVAAQSQTLGVDLAARWLLLGSFERGPSGLRICAEVIDSLSGKIASHAEANGPLEEVLSMLDLVLAELAQGLDLAPSGDELSRIERRETEVLEAYRLYARGRRLFYTFDPDKLEEARQTFESAIKLDPRYGLSWVGLGTIYSFRY